MKNFTILKGFGYSNQNEKEFTFKNEFFNIFTQRLDSLMRMSNDKYNIIQLFNTVLFYCCHIFYQLQIISLMAEKCYSTINSKVLGENYFFKLLISLKFNNIISIQLTNSLLYFLISCLTLISIFLLIILRLISKENKIGFISNLVFYLVKIFNGFFYIPLLDSAFKSYFCNLVSYIYSVTSDYCNDLYSNQIISITLISIAVVLSLLLRYFYYTYTFDHFFFNNKYNSNFMLINSNMYIEICYVLLLVLINNSKIFSSQVAIVLFLIMTFINFLVNYFNSAYIKMFRFYSFIKIIQLYFSFTLAINYYFTLDYVFAYFLIGSICLIYVNNKLVKFKLNNLIYNSRMSNINNITNHFLILEYLIIRLNKLDYSMSKAEIQGYITMMSNEVNEASKFTKDKLHLPFTNKWSNIDEIEVKDEVYLKNFIAFLIEYHVNTKFILNYNLLINLSFYYLDYIEHYVKATYYLIKSRELITSNLEYFIYKRMEKLLKERLLKKVVKDNKSCYELEYLDLSNYFKYDCLRLDLIEEIKNMTSLNYLFWILARNSNYSEKESYSNSSSFIELIKSFKHNDDNKTIYNISKEIKKSNNTIKNLYREMIKINMDYTDIFIIYENYLNNNEYDLNFLTELNNHSSLWDQLCKKDLGKIAYNHLYSSKDAVAVVLSGNLNNLGRIEYISSTCKKLFEYNSSDLLYYPIETLMPDIIGSRHKGYMRLFFKTGEKTLINRTVTSYALNKSNCLFECNINVKILPFFKDITYVGILNKKSNTSSLILVDSNFNIKNISSSLATYFDIYEDIFSNEKIPIFMISKDLFYQCLQEYEKIVVSNKLNDQSKTKIDNNLYYKSTITSLTMDFLNPKSPFMQSSKMDFDKATEVNLMKNYKFNIRQDQFDINVFYQAVKNVFNLSALNLTYDIHALLRKASSIINIFKNQCQDAITQEVDHVQFDRLNNIIKDKVEDNHLVKEDFKLEIDLFNSLLNSGKIDFLCDKMEELFNQIDNKAKENHLDKRKKAETLNFTLETKMQQIKLMDGYEIYVLSIQEDQQYNDNQLNTKSLSQVDEEEGIKPKISKSLFYNKKIDPIETDFKFSKFRKSEVFKKDIQILEEKSNLFKLEFDIGKLKVNQDSQSSSSQVVNKQIKYNRITSKLANLHIQILSKRWIFYIFLLITTLLIMISIILFINLFTVTKEKSLSCLSIYFLTNKFLISFLKLNMGVIQSKITYDSHFKSTMMLNNESIFNYAFKINNLHSLFGFETLEDYFVNIKSQSLELINDTLITYNSLKDLTLLDNKCFPESYLISKQINYQSLSDLDALEILRIENFNKNITSKKNNSLISKEKIIKSKNLLDFPYLLILRARLILSSNDYSFNNIENNKINHINLEIHELQSNVIWSIESIFQDSILNYISEHNDNLIIMKYVIITFTILGFIYITFLISYSCFLSYVRKSIKIRKNLICKVDMKTVADLRFLIYKTLEQIKYTESSLNTLIKQNDQNDEATNNKSINTTITKSKTQSYQ